MTSTPSPNRSRKPGASVVTANATKRLQTAFKKVSGASSLYRYIGYEGAVKRGSYYMIAKFKGSKTPVKENLNTTHLALARQRLLAAKQRRKTGAGHITPMALADACKSGRNGTNQKTIRWVLDKLEKQCSFCGTVVGTVRAAPQERLRKAWRDFALDDRIDFVNMEAEAINLFVLTASPQVEPPALVPA